MAFLIATFATVAVLAASSSAYDSILDGGFEDTATSLEFFDDFNSTENEVSSSANLVEKTIIEHGYLAETHTVTTSDGYFLQMHRIPSSPNSTQTNEPRQPVLLMHGVLDSSGTYVLMGPNQGLAYMLADAGYDVWMGNVRGNRYSRKHELLNPDGNRPQRRQFFNFSWHEIGSLDLPAMIDYVLATNTAFKKLHYIGHSQGTTSFFVMASRRPEYNEKVLLMNALAPVAFMENLSSRFSRVLSRFQPLLQASLSTLGIYEFRPGNSLTTQIQQYLCREEAVTADACQNLVFALLGFNPDLVDKVYYTRKPRPPMKTKVPIIQQHAPAGAAVRQLVHYGQLMRRGSGFRAYDFGRIGNMQQHGSLTPPQYPLSQITAPVALHYGLKDDLAAVVDVKRLAAALPNLIELREVPHPDFDHISFVWGTEVRSLVYNHMLTLMKKAEQNQ